MNDLVAAPDNFTEPISQLLSRRRSLIVIAHLREHATYAEHCCGRVNLPWALEREVGV